MQPVRCLGISGCRRASIPLRRSIGVRAEGSTAPVEAGRVVDAPEGNHRAHVPGLGSAPEEQPCRCEIAERDHVVAAPEERFDQCGRERGCIRSCRGLLRLVPRGFLWERGRIWWDRARFWSFLRVLDEGRSHRRHWEGLLLYLDQLCPNRCRLGYHSRCGLLRLGPRGFLWERGRVWWDRARFRSFLRVLEGRVLRRHWKELPLYLHQLGPNRGALGSHT